jgi:hypothetical protein
VRISSFALATNKSSDVFLRLERRDAVDWLHKDKTCYKEATLLTSAALCCRIERPTSCVS